eukprot:9683652-Alexandrium_andersonii.AAC.1
MVALRWRYEQHFVACCERVSMKSTQMSFAPGIASIARDLERIHGRADWGTSVPSDDGWWQKPT